MPSLDLRDKDLISIKINSKNRSLKESCEVVEELQKYFKGFQKDESRNDAEKIAKNAESLYPGVSVKTNEQLDLEVEIK